MQHPERVDENCTWHPAVVDGAYGSFFGERLASSSEPVVRRRILATLAASTCLAITGLAEAESSTDSASTASPVHSFRTDIFSPYFGETVPVFGFIGERRGEISTTLEIPDTLDRARSTLDRYKNEVLAWHSQLSEGHIAGLNKRLDYLFEDEPESSKSQALPDINSFGVLMAFLAGNPEIKTPSLGYNRDGVFSATWVGDQKLRISLDFISPSNIRWIFVDSREGLKKAVTGAGIVTLDILAGVLDVYGALGWMKS
jgi:hypothetical protein